MNGITTFLRLLVICALAYFGYSYYSLVLPGTLAKFIGFFMAGAMLLTMMFSQAALNSLLKGGLTLVSWPAGVLIAEYLSTVFNFSISRVQAIGVAPLTAALVVMFICSRAERRDQARDIATISISAICLYTMIYVGSLNDSTGLVLACFSTAIGALVMKQQMIVPPLQEKGMLAMIYVPLSAVVISLIF